MVIKQILQDFIMRRTNMSKAVLKTNIESVFFPFFSLGDLI
jgi:hypothetical protein